MANFLSSRYPLSLQIGVAHCILRWVAGTSSQSRRGKVGVRMRSMKAVQVHCWFQAEMNKSEDMPDLEPVNEAHFSLTKVDLQISDLSANALPLLPALAQVDICSDSEAFVVLAGCLRQTRLHGLNGPGVCLACRPSSPRNKPCSPTGCLCACCGRGQVRIFVIPIVNVVLDARIQKYEATLPKTHAGPRCH